jgi:hypothetical protein
MPSLCQRVAITVIGHRLAERNCDLLADHDRHVISDAEHGGETLPDADPG